MRDATPVGASLWRLATGECYCSCGLMIGLSKSAVVKCCHEFVQQLCVLKGNYIKFPTTRGEVQAKINGFSERSKIPDIAGAVDDTHVPIKAPKTNHEDYFNHKHFYSYILQGVVGSTGLFLSVSTGYPGSLHDARVLRLSQIFDAAENDLILTETTVDVNGTIVRPLIVGGSAYPLKPWPLCPFKDKGALSREQKKFNKELSKARIVSEHRYRG
ncbi:Protein ANTAGONIST OF LIKE HETEROCHROMATIN PROTEIN 1 [Acropora cervicornis]|uniref:Protein ANTAGONIST OF LIKE HETEROCHROMATIN PROTEIN 1 n=1 Tax=Acropora cervicornis TaxID=6130 RepID=A0AAD9PX88_ACRCE|nr:Protein ANTAGONIST OF LIKE HETEROCHROMATIN PROTEIN 1 [Acropora cervicornis]